jgi:hypothetical protein
VSEQTLVFRVTLKIRTLEKLAEWYGRPTPEWIKEMVAGPGSIWEVFDVTVEEEK